MAEKDTKSGGYEIDFVKASDARLKCPICKLALRSPFQTECGHRFCESCIKNLIITGSQKCPEDDTVLSLNQIFQDVFWNHKILEQVCYCSNKKLGCDWTGFLRTLEEHYNQCMFVETECPNEGCDVKIIREHLEKHLKEACKFKKISCQYCGEETPEPMMQEHCDSTCSKFPLVCPNGCLENVPRDRMERHVTQDCPNAESACPMTGQCQFQGSRAALRKHMEHKQVEHSVMVNDNISKTQSDIEKIQADLNATQQQQHVLETQADNHREELASFRDVLATLRADVDRHEQAGKISVEEHAPDTKEPRGAEKPADLEDLRARIALLEEQLKMFV